MTVRCFLFIVVVMVSSARVARAAEWFVDPVLGAASGDGSRDHPWQTLETVVAAKLNGTTIKGGDTVWLLAGKHGALSLKGVTFSPALTIAAAEGAAAPQLAAAVFSQSKGVVLRGVAISPYFGGTAGGTIVSVDKSSSDVTVRGCRIFSVEDAVGWTANQWINTASSGVSVSGDHVTISHNQVSNVRFGISVDGPNAVVEYNSVINFSADGLRGLGDYGLFQYNVVKNVYVSQEDGDDNHDDGFQSWSLGPNGPGSGVVKGVVLRGNVIINREDPAQKLTNSLQGIGCFDGFFEDWVVENNVVATDHWHGISFYGMRGGRIVNNTVVDVNDVDPGPPWIMVNAHKDGTKSSGVLVRNNLATDYSIDGEMLTQDHNTELKDLGMYFVDAGGLDLRLKADAPAIDQGEAEGAPEVDADRIARPQGRGVDLGAYEWHEGDAGAGGGVAAEGGAGAGGRGGRGGASAGASGRVGDAADGGSGAADGGAGKADDSGDDGCGCQLSRRNGEAPLGWMVIAGIAAVVLRRRRGGRERLGR